MLMICLGWDGVEFVVWRGCGGMWALECVSDSWKAEEQGLRRGWEGGSVCVPCLSLCFCFLQSMCRVEHVGVGGGANVGRVLS